MIPVNGFREVGFFNEEIVMVRDPVLARAAVLDMLRVRVS
jgi:hypothetical protein